MDNNRTILGVVGLITFALVFLFNYQVGASPAPWSTTGKPVAWAIWADAVKMLAPFATSLCLLYQGFFGNILDSLKSTVKLLGLGTLLLGIGILLEFLAHLVGIDAPTSSASSVFYICGVFLVIWAFFSFPVRLGYEMSRKQKIFFTVMVVILSLITFFIMFFPFMGHPDKLVAEFGYHDAMIASLYVISVVIFFAAVLRLAILFAKSKIGRPFRFFAASGFLIVAYEYYVWFPYTPNISVVNMINLFWILGFLLGMVGGLDLTLQS